VGWTLTPSIEQFKSTILSNSACSAGFFIVVLLSGFIRTTLDDIAEHRFGSFTERVDYRNRAIPSR
jgi:hypothetical protein